MSGKAREGERWMPSHYVEGGANCLTNDALDSISSTPVLKVCAARVAKAS